MPQNLSIAAFVFGAVLLLISLLKGGFKLFGAEVSGTAGGFARAIAFGLGVIMILVGIGFHEQAATPSPSPAPTPAPAPAPAPPIAVPQYVPPPPPPPAPAALARISVRWQISGQETMAFVTTLPDAMKMQLYANVMTTGSDIHVARVFLSNTGTLPVNIFPQNITVMSGMQPFQTMAPAHPMALMPVTLYPGNQTQGVVVFAAPAVIVPGALSVVYNDPTIQVGYER